MAAMRGDAAFDATLRRDVVAHEREAETVALAELGRHANAFVAADDRLAALDVAQLPARRAPVVDDDDGVHPLFLDLHPASADPHLGAVVGRRVEVVRDAAILLGRLDERVALADRMTAPRGQLLQQLVERRASVAVIRISMREASSLVRPMSNFRISYCAGIR